MAKTIIAVYNSLSNARQAVQNLIDNGYDREDISLVNYDESGHYARLIEGGDFTREGTDEVDAAEGAAFGALAGIAVGLGALLIPGIGPVIAAGPIAAALTGGTVGALAGAATGGIIGALVDMGVPEDDAQMYAESVRRGGAMVIAKVPDDMVEPAGTMMSSCGPIDVNRSAENWRQQGWQRFDERGQGLSGQQYNRERDLYTGEEVTNPYRAYDRM